MSAPWARRLIGWGPTPPHRSTRRRKPSAQLARRTHGASQRVRPTHKRSDQRAAWHAGRLFRSNWHAVCLRGLSARSPRSKSPASNARSGAPNHHSSPRALVLSRFPFFWHKFTVVNDDGCPRKSLPHLKNSVNWCYAFFPNTMELMKSFTTANLCQEIVFRDQNQNLAPNSSQLLDPRANHGHATGPNRPAWLNRTV